MLYPSLLLITLNLSQAKQSLTLTTHNTNRHCSVKPRPNDRNMSTQHIATLLDATCCVRLATVLHMLGVVGSGLKMVKFEPTTPNTSTVAKRTQHVASNNVAICCVGMLRSFGRGLSFYTFVRQPLSKQLY